MIASTMTHWIPSTAHEPELTADWNSPAWRDVPSLSVDQFHAQSSDHRPHTDVRLLYSDHALHILFRVQDRYVKSVATHYQEMVSWDSCVELFLQPKPTHGYFNFEWNCGGVMLLYYIEDARRVGDHFAKYQKVSREHADLIRIVSTLPRVNPIEITEPLEWRLQATIPFSLMEAYVGSLANSGTERWRGNLYKCASETSHPHWASWSDIEDELNFHQPDKFGEFILG